MLGAREARRANKDYRRALDRRAHEYRALDTYLLGAGCAAHRRAVARRPLHLIEGELRWVDDFLAELRQS